MSYSNREKAQPLPYVKLIATTEMRLLQMMGFYTKGHYHNTTQHEVGNARYNLQCPFEY